MNLPIRWDIFEEHLDEASFLHRQWENALRSPLYTLAEISSGPEERLLAHLDGLVLAAPHAAQKLLLPALAAEEPGTVFAATFSLITWGQEQAFETVLDALQQAAPAQRAAICRALALVPRADVGQRLATAVTQAPPLVQGELLEVLAYLRRDLPLPLSSAEIFADPARALRIARIFPQRFQSKEIGPHLASPVSEVRAAAFAAGLVGGIAEAFAACEATVAKRGPGVGAAAVCLGLSGDEKSTAALVSALSDAAIRAEAVWALGFSGRVTAADALLELLMQDKRLAPLAAEAFCAITGLVIEKPYQRDPERWKPEAKEEEEDAPALDPDSVLPKPIPEAIAQWWKVARPKLDPAQRYLRGSVWSPEGLLQELVTGPARRREALALALAVLTRGKAQVAWDALTARQRRELQEARKVRISSRSYRSLLP